MGRGGRCWRSSCVGGAGHGEAPRGWGAPWRRGSSTPHSTCFGLCSPSSQLLCNILHEKPVSEGQCFPECCETHQEAGQAWARWLQGSACSGCQARRDSGCKLRLAIGCGLEHSPAELGLQPVALVLSLGRKYQNWIGGHAACVLESVLLSSCLVCGENTQVSAVGIIILSLRAESRRHTSSRHLHRFLQFLKLTASNSHGSTLFWEKKHFL